MSQNVIIGVVLIAVVGAGLYLSRRPSSGTAEAGSSTLFGKPLPFAANADTDNPAALVNTGFSTGTSQAFTPDAEPIAVVPRLSGDSLLSLR